jgi:hypothetical protein
MPKVTRRVIPAACRLIGEVTIRMFGEPGDHMRRQQPFAHIGERCVIDDPPTT